MTALKILVIDDDADARHLLEQVLRTAGYDVTLVADAEQALALLADQPVDIILSDINLPGLSGLDLLREVRDRQLDCEVVLLTGLPAVDSAIQALRDGAVDYLTKPVTREALLGTVARVRERLTQARQRQQALAMLEAGLKHFTGQASPNASAPHDSQPSDPAEVKQYRVGPVVVDLDRFVVEVAGRPIDATPSELEILHYLCRNAGRAVTPVDLVQAIRGYRVEPDEAQEIIRPHISNLRRKLVAASPEADVIATVRGVGYILKTPSAAGDR